MRVLLAIAVFSLGVISTPVHAAALIDTDSDGVGDVQELSYGSNPIVKDTDKDGLNDGVENANRNGAREVTETDALSTDTDQDGIKDGAEDSDQSGDVGVGESDPLTDDTDGDGVKDGQDNCPDQSNTGQEDWDFDGDGNRCDSDSYLTLHVRNSKARTPATIRIAGRSYYRIGVGRVLVFRGSVVPKENDGEISIDISYRPCRSGCSYRRIGSVSPSVRESSGYKRGYRFRRTGMYIVKAVLEQGADYSSDETIVRRVLVSY